MIRQFGAPEFLFLLTAAEWTLLLSAIAFVCGGLVGLVVATLRISRAPVMRAAASGYIQLIQGTPLLMVLFLAYYGLSLAGYRLPSIVAAAIGLTLYSSAFLAEIWRGCIEAVPRQQWEAGASLALTRLQQLRYVILPQAVRIAVPPTVGFMVQIIKNTSVASIIGFVELARAGQLINNATFQPFRVYLAVAAIYFGLCYPLSLASRFLERRLHGGYRH